MNMPAMEISMEIGSCPGLPPVSPYKMAKLLKTSRSQVDRLLDPNSDITLSSLQRAAAMVGRRVSIELV